MAQRKNGKPETTFLDQIASTYNRVKSYPVIREQWYVVEVTPSTRFTDEYQDGWTGRKTEVVGDYYDTLEEADKFCDEWEPNKGNHFYIKKRVLREVTEQRWFDF